MFLLWRVKEEGFSPLVPGTLPQAKDDATLSYLSSMLLKCILLSVINFEKFFNMFANSNINKNIPLLFLRFLLTCSKPFWVIWLTGLAIQTHSFRAWEAIVWAFLLKASRALHKKWGLEGEIIFKERVINQLRLSKPNDNEKDWIENLKIKSTLR